MRRALTWCLVFSFLLPLLLSCQPTPVLRLGIIAYDYSHEPNVEGSSTDHGSRLAAQEWNQSGKLRIELERVWVSIAPEDSVDAVKLLANTRGVAAIIGPSSSSQAIPAGAAAEAAKIPLIATVSSNPATTLGRDYVYRMCFLDPAQARAQADIGLKGSHGGTLSIISYDSESSSAEQASVIADQLRAAGRPLRAQLALSGDDPEFEHKISRQGPWNDAAVFLPASSDFAVRAARALRSLGFRGLLVGGDGWSRNEIKSNPDFDGSVMTTNYWSGQQTPGNADFARAYQAFAGTVPGDTAALTYDAVSMLAMAALRKGRTDSAGIQAALKDGTVFHGVAGEVRFEGSGNPVREVVVLRFQNGSVTAGGPR